MSTQYNEMWSRDNGNYTHALNYPLNENSIVVDLGAFHGVWASQIIEKYNPNVFLFEPVKEFYDYLVDKFQNNPKVKIFNYGIAADYRMDTLYLRGDGTSKYITGDTPVSVEFIPVEKMFELIGVNKVDLAQINIEGEEFPVLEKIIENKLVTKFSHLQIQFHTFIEDAEIKRENIQTKLSESFDKMFDYPFVFEGWKLK